MDDEPLHESPRRQQQHFSNVRMWRDPRYSGPLDKCSVPEVTALIAEAARYTGVPYDLPLPPYGLPGHRGEPKPEVMSIIRECVRYWVALCEGEKKTLWNIHNRIAEELRRAFNEGREAGHSAAVETFTQNARYSRPEQQNDRAGLVYFIRSEAGPIKIGKANNPASRVRELQTSHFAKLTVAATCKGGRRREQEYHAQFADHRLHGEWFDPHPDILAEIERLTSAGSSGAL